MATVAQQAVTRSAVQELAAGLLPSTPELARGMADHLAAAIPEIAAIDAVLVAMARAEAGR
jgi:hypothetical protein